MDGGFPGGHWGCPLAAFLPGPEGGGSVSQTGFWDLAKTNTALDFAPHFGWDAGDLGSLLQISLNILKTDGDNQRFLASISSITLQYTFCQQKWDVMLKSILPATAGHIKTVTHGSLLSLLPYLYQEALSRDAAWFQTRFITDCAVRLYSVLWTNWHLIFSWGKCSAQWMLNFR